MGDNKAEEGAGSVRDAGESGLLPQGGVGGDALREMRVLCGAHAFEAQSHPSCRTFLQQVSPFLLNH